VTVSGLDICDLATVRSVDLSQYSGVITIEEPDTEDPFRTDVVPQLVLQFHDIDMTMLDYVEPELEHVQQAVTFAQEIDGPLLVHCRAGVSRSAAIALAIVADRLGAGNERQACEWLRQTYPLAQPNRLIVFLADEVLGRSQTLITVATVIIKKREFFVD
jgi:predicted protein tyrosine phosphatase